MLIHPVDPVSDFDHYHRLARSIAEHGEYALVPGTPTAYRPPAWPFVLGLEYAVLGPDPQKGAFLGTLLSWSAAVVTAVLAFRLLRPRFALAATAAVALYPAGIAYGAVLGTEHLATLLTVGLVAVLASKDFGPGRALLVGAILGALALTRAEYGLVGAVVVALVLLRRYRPRPMLRWGAIVIAGTALALSPWVVRNAVEFGEFIPTSTNGGVNFYLGSIADGYSAPPLLSRFPPDVSEHPKARDNFYWRKGADEVAEDPLRWLGRDARRAITELRSERGTLTWVGGWPATANWSRVAALYWACVLALSVVGFATAVARRLPGAWLPVVGMVTGGILLKSAFVVSHRDRLPLVPLFILLAALGAQALAPLVTRARARVRRAQPA